MEISTPDIPMGVFRHIFSRLSSDDLKQARRACKGFYSYIQKFYRSIALLDRAVVAIDEEERNELAREAFEDLLGNLGYVDVPFLCKRFEELRYYEAVVRLALRMDPPDCYSIIGNAIHRLGADDSLSRAACGSYISTIVRLVSDSSNRSLHEYLYQAVYDLGPFLWGEEWIEYSGPEVGTAIQKVIQGSLDEAHLGVTLQEFLDKSNVPMLRSQFKYVKVLADYYFAASRKPDATVDDLMVAVKFDGRLADARLLDDVMGQATILSLKHRRFFLNRAWMCARNLEKEAQKRLTRPGYSRHPGDIPSGISQLMDLLGKRFVASKFQILIKDEIEAAIDDEKAKELSLNLKSFSELYDQYVIPHDLWEIGVEMQYYATFSGCPVSHEATWDRLIRHALSKGGISEACAAMKRAVSRVDPPSVRKQIGDDIFVVPKPPAVPHRLGYQVHPLPLDFLCLQLEKAALDRVVSGVERVGDDDIALALLAACRDDRERVLCVYDGLLSSDESAVLKLRLLRSVLCVLKVGMHDRAGDDEFISDASKRYMTILEQLHLRESQIEAEDLAQEFERLMRIA